MNDFKAKYRLQVVNTIFLTDGEGGSGFNIHGIDSYGSDVVIHDRKTKRYYKNVRSNGYAATFKNWLDWFYDRTGMRIINFYIFGSSKNELANAFRSFDVPEIHIEAHNTYDKFSKIISPDELKDVTKNGFYYRDDIAGYRSVFFIRAKNLKVSNNHMEDLDDAATAAKLRNAYIKTQREKLSSRMFMQQIAELIS